LNENTLSDEVVYTMDGEFNRQMDEMLDGTWKPQLPDPERLARIWPSLPLNQREWTLSLLSPKERKQLEKLLT